MKMKPVVKASWKLQKIVKREGNQMIGIGNQWCCEY